MYWFFYIGIFMLLTVIFMSSCINFYTLTFLCYWHLHLFHYVLIVTHWHFYITHAYTYFIIYWLLHFDVFILFTFILLSSCIYYYTITFLYYLKLYSYHHVLIFTHYHFYITYNYTYFIMYWFVFIDLSMLLTFILILSFSGFYALTFLCYLHLYLFHDVFIFTHWTFYIPYIYIYFRIDWVLYIDIFMLLTVIYSSSCINF